MDDSKRDPHQATAPEPGGDPAALPNRDDTARPAEQQAKRASDPAGNDAGPRKARAATDDIQRNPDGTFAPGQSANPAGRPLGVRNKLALEIEEMMRGPAKELTQKLIDYVWLGYPAALRIYFSRMAPVPKGRPVPFPLPKLEHEGDIDTASMLIVKAVAAGELTPAEASELQRVLDAFERRQKRWDLEERVANLERWVRDRGPDRDGQG
jgi:hypothetical protein